MVAVGRTLWRGCSLVEATTQGVAIFRAKVQVTVGTNDRPKLAWICTLYPDLGNPKSPDFVNPESLDFSNETKVMILNHYVSCNKKWSACIHYILHSRYHFFFLRTKLLLLVNVHPIAK